MKRTGAALTDNEKSMVISVHLYFLGVNFITDDHQKAKLRKRVAEALGISESTVGAVVADWHKHGDNTFTPHKTLGRPKLQPDESLSEILRTKILNANKTAEQLSTHTLQQFLTEKGYSFSKWKLLRVLHKLGFYYEGQNDVPHRPEVFLDESYRHLHHNSRNTWVPHHGVVLAPGHGPLVVIFGAIIVFRNGSSNKLNGELVPNSVHIWDPTIKPSGNRGRKRNNAEEWDDIPNVIKEANIVPNQVDYHGNFTAEIFEDLFQTLCKTIHEKYGSVCIHMDGASYHKRQVKSIPTSSSKKQELIDWLNAHDIFFSGELRKPELLEHCELQPIEGVWSIVKGEVACSGPHPNLLSVRNTLLNAFKEKISSKAIVGLWRRALKNAKDYFESDEHVRLMDDEFDAYSSSDEDPMT